MDVILCEVHIPGIDGIETFKLLQQKKINPEIPFILIAHEFEAKVFQEAINNKIDDLYRVPLNLERIYQRITFLKSYKRILSTSRKKNKKVRNIKSPF
ncbi:MAG: response regulator [Bacteroidales bacterium]|nr:response regulator [Bacteroidales bacterium]